MCDKRNFSTFLELKFITCVQYLPIKTLLICKFRLFEKIRTRVDKFRGISVSQNPKRKLRFIAKVLQL